MSKMANHPDHAADLRTEAETRWHKRQAGKPAPPPDADTQRLLHELEVHQIELEMQNDELRRARAEVDAALEKYTELYDFAPVGYLTLDRQGCIREANLAGAAMLGANRSAMANWQFGFFVCPADRPAFDGFLRQVFSGDSRERCEVSMRVEGRPPFDVELDGVVSESGRECRIALTDISERKRAAEDRLILGKLESTGVLAGGLAHDFNNLLTAIILDLDLAETIAPAGGDLARCLANAKNAAVTAGSLTQQILTFSKGGAFIRKAAVLPELIRESARAAVSGSRVRCDLSLAGDLWPAMVDEGQIGQVVRNLVLNAREATPEGGVVSIRAENVGQRTRGMPALPPGRYVRVTIADRGVGMSPELLAKIFDPYFSTKRRGDQKGMGLGLTICHAIIQRHGGAIAVKSAPGEGTAFDLYLPAAALAVEDAKAAGPRGNPQRRKLLVMDDEEPVRELCGKALQMMGHEVELVENGQSALDTYGMARKQGRPFDAVFLDLTIRNGLGGRETILALRQIEPCVKAVVMSGYAGDPVMEEHVRHGFAGALVKPFGIEKLRNVLSQVLGNK